MKKSIASEPPGGSIAVQLEPRIWSSVIRGLILPMEELHLDPSAMLAQCGIPADALEKSRHSIPLRKYLQFMNLAEKQSNEPLIGIHLARSAGPETLGALGFLFLSSQSLVAALSQFCTYVNLLQDVTSVRLTQDAGRISFSYDIARFEQIESRIDVEFSIGVMCRLIRMYAGSSIAFESVRFRHAPAAPKSEYHRLLRSAVEFEQAENAVILPSSASQIKGHNFDPELARILTDLLDEQLAHHTRARSFAELVADRLFSIETMSRATAGALADALGVSEATFYRRLRQDGTSLGEIIDRRRFELAKEYLANRSLETTRIAHLIGFSESASFTRAFKRWSGGVTPSAFRRSLFQQKK